MNKKLAIGITFLSIFILIGLGYKPIIAENQINEVKESFVSVNKVTKLNNFYIKSFKSILQSDYNCKFIIICKYPILCNIIHILWLLGKYFQLYGTRDYEKLLALYDWGDDLNCWWWIPPP